VNDSIKIVTEPAVYVVGRQTVDAGELTRFLADHGFDGWTTDSPAAGETLVEVAARTCYQSFRGGRPHAEHLRHLIEVGHGSTLEHAVWSLLIVGVSRSLSHELVRHRHLSPSQLSQRYVDSADVAFVVPPELSDEVAAARNWISRYAGPGRGVVDIEAVNFWLTGDEEGWSANLTRAIRAGLRWLRSVIQARDEYRHQADYLARKLTPAAFEGENEEWPSDITVAQMAEGLRPETRTALRKASRQAARSVLPNCTETKIFVTANARALRGMIEQRGSRHAEPEIRRLALAILTVMQREAPNLFNDYTLTPLPDGSSEITTPYRKV
jgi:thymidylate synthase (FAD)